jgi:4-diphosphocytidyl-2-C-methyl-D-erythritol kinase
VQAPAKINLTLEVLARRTDGYHGVRSVMVPLALSDELTVEPNDRFIFECDRDDLAGDANLCVAAMRAIFADLPPVRLRLRKRIPTQAGLGGGSSDAAAVLRMAMEGAFGATPQRDWLAVARALGSDVPFFLAGTAALVEGTGERVTPAGALPPWQVLIVQPPAAISTADAYRAIDERPRPQRPRDDSVSVAMNEALQRGDFASVESLMQNDFESVAVTMAPEVASGLAALRGAGASNAMLAGSGSCVFTIARDAEAIAAIGRSLKVADDYRTFVTRFGIAAQWCPSTFPASLG